MTKTITKKIETMRSNTKTHWRPSDMMLIQNRQTFRAHTEVSKPTPSNSLLLCPTRPARWSMIWKPVAWRDQVPIQHLATLKNRCLTTRKNQRTVSTRINTMFLHGFQKRPLLEPTHKTKKHVFRRSQEGPRLARTVLSSEISGARTAEKNTLEHPINTSQRPCQTNRFTECQCAPHKEKLKSCCRQ